MKRTLFDGEESPVPYKRVRLSEAYVAKLEAEEKRRNRSPGLVNYWHDLLVEDSRDEVLSWVPDRDLLSFAQTSELAREDVERAFRKRCETTYRDKDDPCLLLALYTETRDNFATLLPGWPETSKFRLLYLYCSQLMRRVLDASLAYVVRTLMAGGQPSLFMESSRVVVRTTANGEIVRELAVPRPYDRGEDVDDAMRVTMDQDGRDVQSSRGSHHLACTTTHNPREGGDYSLTFWLPEKLIGGGTEPLVIGNGEVLDVSFYRYWTMPMMPRDWSTVCTLRFEGPMSFAPTPGLRGDWEFAGAVRGAIFDPDMRCMATFVAEGYSCDEEEKFVFEFKLRLQTVYVDTIVAARYPALYRGAVDLVRDDKTNQLVFMS